MEAEFSIPNPDKTVIHLTGNLLDDNSVVQMAQELYRSFTYTSLSLNSQKLIDVYLALKDGCNREVVVDLKKVTKDFGLKYIRREAVQSYLQQLLSLSVILFSDAETDNAMSSDRRGMALFDKAEVELGYTLRVIMTCSADAEPLMSCIHDHIPQYIFQNAIKLSSSHSYIMYKFIESMRDNDGSYPQTFEINFEKLRAALMSSRKSLSQFKRFNSEYLKPCRHVIQDNTDTRFSFSPVRYGRKANKVKFTIYEREFSDNTESVNDIDKSPNTKKAIKLLSAACDREFSSSQIQILSDFIGYFIESDIDKYYYLREAYTNFNSKTISVEEKFSAFRLSIEKDLSPKKDL